MKRFEVVILLLAVGLGGFGLGMALGEWLR